MLTGDPPLERVIVDGGVTRDLGAGGMYFRVFRPVRIRLGEPVRVRISLPSPYSGGVDARPRPLFGPYLEGDGIVVRDERVEVEGVRGRGIAVRFDHPLEINLTWGD
jgi:hypothetical protein